MKLKTGLAGQKTDSGLLPDKLLLRRSVLKEANFKHLDVLDLFAGAGEIWKELGKDFTVASYLPVDEKPRQPGTLKLHVDVRSVRAFRPDNFNVIDVDAYGSPWELVPHLFSGTKPLAIFLTHGTIAIGWKSLDFALKTACGIPRGWPVPISRELVEFCAMHFLRQYSKRIVFAQRMHRTGRADVHYYGLLLR